MGHAGYLFEFLREVQKELFKHKDHKGCTKNTKVINNLKGQEIKRKIVGW
jgi:hypothetical protein